MKMIDTSEVESLNRAKQEREKEANMSTVQGRKLERKRKLLEDTKASGLRNNRDKKVARRSGDVIDGAAPHATAVNGQTDPAGQTKEGNAPGTAAAVEGQQKQQPQQEGTWESLLEKSNKLSPDDRQSIQQFFAHRALTDKQHQPPLPLPAGCDESTGIWKVKLNEDKTIDPNTKESVKETLYLELDYRTQGYKKTRKIKRK